MKRSMIFTMMGLALGFMGTQALANDGLNCTSGPKTADVGPSSNSRADQKLNVAVLRQLPGGQELLCVNERNASVAVTIGAISGYQMDTKLVGMDYRVQDGKLYGVGDKGGVYTVDTTTAMLTFVNRISRPLNGTLFGVDFNPAADRLRIISNASQNLRHNIGAPVGAENTLEDGNLNTGVPTPPVPPETQAGRPPEVAGVATAAYTNNDEVATTSTTMFVINTGGTTDNTAIQSPANSGIVVNTGNVGVNLAGPVGFDIYSTLRSGAAISNKALASGVVANETAATLFNVDLLTGKASEASRFAPGVEVVDIAIPLNQRLAN